jgi:uncharacterized protein YjdB
VVHRDVKPANILLDADGDPVVTDFGIAKVAEAPGHTRIGTVVGTPTYMSPEQCLGYDVGPASDQYALGVVVYELLTGQPPFGGNGMAMMRAHTETPPPPLRRARAEIPDAVESAVLKMLAKKPEDRFPDLAAAIVAFDAHPLSALGPLRSEMTELAGAANAETHLAEIVRTPRSPAPASVSMRPRIASVEVTSPTASVEAGECIVLAAVARSESGDRVSESRFKWSSSNPAIATVDSAGVLSAVAPGLTTITASSGAVTGQVDVSVVAAGVASIEVTVPPELRSGVRATLAARALDRHGVQLDVPVTWTSRHPNIASISPLGVISPKRRGTAVVVAAAAGVERAVSLTIAAAPVVELAIDGVPAALGVGTSVTMRAIARVARGADDAPERRIDWTSSDPSVATVSADGVVTGRSAGQATITAACDDVRSSASVAVVSVRAASVAITSPPGPVRLGDILALKATVYDVNRKVVSRPVTWRSTDPRVASVDPTGKLVAHVEGWAIVTAEVDGVDAHIEVVVRQQVIPTSASGRRELNRLSLKWWLLLATVAGILALGWRYLRP